MDRLLSSVTGKRWIIGAALIGMVLLGGCSALKLGYRQGPSLAHWWLDDQVDFESAQSVRVKEALARWFDWHRQTQLGDTVALLVQLRQESAQAVSAEQICRLGDQAQALLATAVDQALPLALPIVQSLGPAQLQHIDRQARKRIAKQREELLNPDPQRRHEAQLDRAVSRYEGFYGRLEDSQRQLIDEALRKAPIDVARQFELREQRQAELLQALTAVASRDALATPAALERLRTVARRYDGREPLQPELSAAQERHTCALIAQLHNSATPAQRRQLAKQLAGWEADLRALMPAAGTAANPAPTPR